jgi:hypothetical protein
LTKSLKTIILIVLYLIFTTDIALAFRCSGTLISVGDPSFKVLRECGEPIYKELVGYTLTEDKRREYKIEEWVYGPIGKRYIHLIFKGGILDEIKSIHEWARKINLKEKAGNFMAKIRWRGHPLKGESREKTPLLCKKVLLFCLAET